MMTIKKLYAMARRHFLGNTPVAVTEDELKKALDEYVQEEKAKAYATEQADSLSEIYTDVTPEEWEFEYKAAYEDYIKKSKLSDII